MKPSNVPFFDFDIEGAKELDKVLKGLPKAVAKAQLKSALRKAAKPVVKDAKANAWRSTGRRGGAAAKTDSKVAHAAQTIKAYVMTKTVVPAAVAIGPGEKGWWLVFQEYGTPQKPAHPFMRPAWEKNKRRVLASFSKNIWFVLNRMAKRLTKQAYAGKLSASGRKALGL